MKDFKQTKVEGRVQGTRHTHHADSTIVKVLLHLLHLHLFFCLDILKKILFISERPFVSKREHALQ